MDEYSTMNPATSSDSASGRSKGGRLVSASAEMKNSTTIGRCGSQYQFSRPRLPSCAATMAPKFIEPVEMMMPMMISPSDTS